MRCNVCPTWGMQSYGDGTNAFVRFACFTEMSLRKKRHEKSLRYRPEALLIRVGFQNKREYFLYALLIYACLYCSLL